ncbi:MAG: hypothetical protein KAR42_17735 [candidate division Zixibacteria bacterium]|nr:hypothetical protein [candidate division Zixibacteria bacterium]
MVKRGDIFLRFSPNEAPIFIDWIALIDRPIDEKWQKDLLKYRKEYRAIKRREIENKSKAKE